MTHVGFTGTRGPITLAQRSGIHAELIRDFAYGDVLHHGCCVNADETAHQMAWSMSYHIVAHPPTDTKLRAWVEFSDFWDSATDVLLPPAPYLERNRNIVDAVSRMIATPDGPERERSGTWSTVRYARRVGKPVVVIMPDGTVQA